MPGGDRSWGSQGHGSVPHPSVLWPSAWPAPASLNGGVLMVSTGDDRTSFVGREHTVGPSCRGHAVLGVCLAPEQAEDSGNPERPLSVSFLFRLTLGPCWLAPTHPGKCLTSGVVGVPKPGTSRHLPLGEGGLETTVLLQPHASCAGMLVWDRFRGCV